MNAAQLMDILLKIPANKRKDYNVQIDFKDAVAIITDREAKVVSIQSSKGK